MSFGTPLYLYLLLLIPPLIFLLINDYKWYQSKTKSLYGNLRNRQVDVALDKVRLRRGVLSVLVSVLTILALAAPQFGERRKDIKRKVVDVIIAIDTSKSMLAEDIYPNRLTKAKEALSYLIDNLKGNRVGVIAFSGLAFTQCPLTFDTKAAKLLLDLIDTDLIPLPGTSIAEAVNLAIKSFPKDSASSRALILLTDGEDHEGGVQTAAEKAKSQGITIFTVGIGEPRGEPIPIRDVSKRVVGYKKDKKGSVVISALNEELLKDIAQRTGGKYYAMKDIDFAFVDAITAELASLEKKEIKSGLYSLNEHRFQYFLLFAVIFMLLELFLPHLYFYLGTTKKLF